MGNRYLDRGVRNRLLCWVPNSGNVPPIEWADVLEGVFAEMAWLGRGDGGLIHTHSLGVRPAHGTLSVGLKFTVTH